MSDLKELPKAFDKMYRYHIKFGPAPSICASKKGSESSHQLFVTLYTLSIYPSVYTQRIRTLQTFINAYSAS